MADSDNSRTLPSVTRGSNFHLSAEASLAIYPWFSVPVAARLDDGDADFAHSISLEWRATRQRLIESLLQGQGLEARLLSMLGLPLHASEAETATAK